VSSRRRRGSTAILALTRNRIELAGFVRVGDFNIIASVAFRPAGGESREPHDRQAELEWVFLSETPSSAANSRIRLGLTSNSRASSLIRIYS